MNLTPADVGEEMADFMPEIYHRMNLTPADVRPYMSESMCLTQK
ncbi:hypothetical protein HMPREF1981_00897 [Bacteroides pyogenes F0041]|uniref:Uncharacterized protein n=1 Tax=Bacteroides pyogenes F0041 TaxID=1321819 RepID=U2E2I8_9BACE|nr:hypothetical protein HMPREF1981_00897 [Bacteroides pyogenes F0041]